MYVCVCVCVEVGEVGRFVVKGKVVWEGSGWVEMGLGRKARLSTA